MSPAGKIDTNVFLLMLSRRITQGQQEIYTIEHFVVVVIILLLKRWSDSMLESKGKYQLFSPFGTIMLYIWRQKD